MVYFKNVFHWSFFHHTLCLCSSLGVSDQVSHPTKTAGKIIVLCILIFNFFHSHKAGANKFSSRGAFALLLTFIGDFYILYRPFLLFSQQSCPGSKCQKSTVTRLTDVRPVKAQFSFVMHSPSFAFSMMFVKFTRVGTL
jgi:hypothetical protein